MINLLEKGEKIIQQTRSFDAAEGTSFAIRDKEEADDYRYFPEPDLTPFSITDDFINSVKITIPRLQEERVNKYRSDYQLSEYDAVTLTDEKDFSDYFEQVVHALLPSPLRGEELGVRCKAAANWMLGPVKSWLNDNNKEIENFPVSPVKIASLIKLVDDGGLSFSVASAKILHLMINHPAKEPGEIAEEQNPLLDKNINSIEP